MGQKTGHLYEFGPFLLDTAAHLLLRHGEPVPLTPKTYDTLLVLVENHGRMLSKDELMRALWPSSYVEESNLTQQISMLRKALGESPGEDRYVVTIQGRGYRFAAAVKGSVEQAEPVIHVPPVAEPRPAEEIAEAPVEATGLPWFRRLSVLLAAVTVLTIALVLLGYAIYRKQSIKGRHGGGPSTLAVLPFQSLREDPRNDFLGFALADAVITKLGYVKSLTVRPSSAVERYRKQAIDIRSIASDLHVDTLLTGNFIRDGADLRITSQLIDVKTQSILWKGTFDLQYDRLLTVQDRVTQQIIKGLELRLSPVEVERLRPEKPIDPAAYEYYLRGVDLYSRNDYAMAIKMLQKSAEIDPNYALTWAHLGRSHTANASFELGGRTEYLAAQNAYEKALELQPALTEARIFTANRFTDTGRVESAVPLLREALQTSPNHAEAHWELGYAYRFGGMLNESVAECERARQLDPEVKFSTSTLTGYLYLGQYDRFLQSLGKNNSGALIVFYRGLAEYYRKMTDEAAKEFDRAFELHPSLLQARVGKALSHAIGRRRSKGLDILHQIEDEISERGVGDPEALYKIAQVYAVLGDRVSALRVLRHSIEGGFFPYPYLTTDPLLDSLRRDGEFTRLLLLARRRHEAFRRKFF